jgi:amidophosphoribosyltransferase
VYGIDMPTPDELVAHDRTVEEIRQVIGCDALIYQDVEGMKRAIGSLSGKLDGFDASCFDGVYVTGDVTAQTIAAMNSLRADTAEKIGEDGGAEGGADVSRLALPNPQEA